MNLRVLDSRTLLVGMLAVLAVVVTGLLIGVPIEARLGQTVRLVILHGALARVGLFCFGVAGLLGMAALAWRRSAAIRWCRATQETALAVWVFYIVSSMVATYLAWGVAVAWGEPRVEASAKVLLASGSFFVLVRWIREDWFTAVANIVLAVVAWVVVKSASVVQHPFDPITGSDDSFRLYFALVSGVVTVMAVLLARWFYLRPGPRRPIESVGTESNE